MSDAYQPIYDAVRSRLSNGDIGEAVRAAVESAGLSWAIDAVKSAQVEAAQAQMAPSVLYRPTLTQIGAGWWASYGDGAVRAHGASPAAAMAAFDVAWYAKVD